MVDLTDRYVSYYGNLSYTYKDKYIFSGSSRWDASNIFGVKSNQKGVGLWSIGGSWVLDKETFYSSNIFSKVKLSSTFGFMGNIDSDASSFPTIAYSTNSLTGNQIATIRSPGNPNLRWEQVGMFNTSVDFSLIGNVLSGTIQFYHKNSTDLLGVMELDPTTGFTSNNYKMNYASLKTQGFDLELNSNIINNKSINWNSKVLFSYVSDKVTDYRSDGNGLLEIYLSMDNSHPVVGNSLYTLYSFPWHGLDKQTGDPLVKINNDLSKDYATYWNNIDPKKDLVVSGKKIPPFFGSFRNTLSIKKFQVSAMIVFRGGHVFRRNSINYNLLSNNWQGHEEYNLRWQNPGDELHTNVPSIPTQFNQNRDRIYNFSEVNVERGDVLRLHDVSIMYYGELKKKYLKEYRISFYVKDPMIIWKLNKEGIDPDFPLIDFRNRPLFSVGINLTL